MACAAGPQDTEHSSATPKQESFTCSSSLSMYGVRSRSTWLTMMSAAFSFSGCSTTFIQRLREPLQQLEFAWQGCGKLRFGAAAAAPPSSSACGQKGTLTHVQALNQVQKHMQTQQHGQQRQRVKLVKGGRHRAGTAAGTAGTAGTSAAAGTPAHRYASPTGPSGWLCSSLTKPCRQRRCSVALEHTRALHRRHGRPTAASCSHPHCP